MNLPSQIQTLQQRLSQPMPGFTAQESMAPKLRYNLSDIELAQKKAKPSSVLISIYKKNEEFYTVLTQRHSYKGVHSDQVSFPGGKMDESDPDLTFTALREACEEVNICNKTVTVLGEITPLYIPPSNFLVTPIVAYLDNIPELKPQESEVKEIIEVPIRLFLDKSNIKETAIHLANGTDSLTPYFDIYGKVVWGATAMILGEFVAILEEINFI